MEKKISERTVNIQRSVRPIRLAFLVNPSDKKTLQKIFEINTCIWGGIFNGIIPTFKRTPAWWHTTEEFRPNATEITQGYLEAFEPDYIVAETDEIAKKVNFNKERIIRLNDLLRAANDSDHSQYSLNVTEILKQSYEKTFQFQLRNRPKVILPEAKKTSEELFCSAVFGAFPKSQAHMYFSQNYKTVFEPEILKISSENLSKTFLSRPITPIGFTHFKLEATNRSWTKDRTIFLLDPKQPSDLIDFWNLRALGWNVMPIPKSWAQDCATDCREYIKKNYRPLRGNRNGVMHSTTALKARSISNKEFKEFTESILVTGKETALVSQYWQPRVWDSWARKSDYAIRCDVSHREEEVECVVKDGRITIPILQPDFELGANTSLTARFANVIGIREYGTKEESAFVFPPDLKNIENLLETAHDNTVHTNSEGLVSLISYYHRLHWRLPNGFAVFQKWLAEKGYKAELSPAGETSRQMIKALGGPWGVRTIANIEIIRLLNKMAAGLVETPTESDDPATVGQTRSRMEGRQRWFTLLLEANRNDRSQARRHLNDLIDKGALKIGYRLECSACTQPNWYPLGELRSKLECERCLQYFDFPASDPPNGAWYYRTQGPFSAENYAHGAYAVALAIRFLTKSSDIESTWTPSMKMKKSGKIDLECDFAIWRSAMRFGIRSSTLLLGECKTFGKFEKKDLTRAKQLAEAFPGQVIVFATLRDELTKTEKRSIATLAKWGRASIRSRKGKSRAPVLILTAHELLGKFGPTNCWKDAGGKYAAFARDWRGYAENIRELCNATQQLHLDMESYDSWREVQWRKRAAKRRVGPSS